MELPKEQMIFEPGDYLMDVKAGRLAVFEGYTPVDKEFVATIHYVGEFGSYFLRPFDLDRFKPVERRAQAKARARFDVRARFAPAEPAAPAAPPAPLPFSLPGPRKLNLDT